MTRNDHSFQFAADEIAAAARRAAIYHRDRATFWQRQMDLSYEIVERTIGAKIVKREVTGGWRPEVTVDYGDKAAYARMGESAVKLQAHQEAADRFETDARLYETQGARAYELSVDDVHHYRLVGGQREPE